jgi:hypothetical protein
MSDTPTTPASPVPPVTPVEGAPVQKGQPTHGLSHSPGLREMPDSTVPGLPEGVVVKHVSGPQQAPCDPVAAGLDLEYDPLTAAENRVITQTGAFAAGTRPGTFPHATGSQAEPAPADFTNVAAPSDAEGKAKAGPSTPAAPVP